MASSALPLRELPLSHAASAANIVRKRPRKRPRCGTSDDDIPGLRRSERVRRKRESDGEVVQKWEKKAVQVTKKRKASVVVPKRKLVCEEIVKSPEPKSEDSGRVCVREERLEDVVVRNVMRSPTSLTRDFLSLKQTKEIDARVREIVVDWLMEVSEEYHTRAQTLALAVNYMDRFLARKWISRDKLQLLAVVCMLIACKIEETDPPNISDIVFICGNSVDKVMVTEMEKVILGELDFLLTVPTHFSVVSYIASRMEKKSERVLQMAEFAAHIVLLDAQLSSRPAGVVAVGCIMVGMQLGGLDAGCLEGCPECVLEVCNREAADVAMGVFKAWRRIHESHEEDHSRWLILRWPTLSNLFGRFCGKKKIDM